VARFNGVSIMEKQMHRYKRRYFAENNWKTFLNDSRDSAQK